MPSNQWNIWDILSRDSHFFKKDLLFPMTILSPDTFYLQFIINEIKDHHQIDFKLASDITIEWIEDKVSSHSLFSLMTENESTLPHNLILNAQELSSEACDFLVKVEDWGESDLILCFSGKPKGKAKKLLDALKKTTTVTEIKEAKFWEYRKVFDFFTMKFNLVFDIDARNYLMEFIAKDSASYFECFSLLRGYSEGYDKINLKLVKEIFTKKNLDPFEMAKLFSEKAVNQFFSVLAQNDYDYDEIRSLSFFMQSHLFKIYDVSYITKKDRVSKYDEEIRNYHKQWDSDRLLFWISFFSEIEILSKRKDFLLNEKIKEAYLASLV